MICAKFLMLIALCLSFADSESSKKDSTPKTGEDHVVAQSRDADVTSIPTDRLRERLDEEEAASLDTATRGLSMQSNIDDLLLLIHNHDLKNPVQLILITRKFSDLQTPLLKVADLIEVLKGVRSSISEIRFKSKLLVKHDTNPESYYKRNVSQTFDFASSEGKLFLDVNETTNGEGARRVTRGYDGEFVRSVQSHTQLDNPAGSVGYFNGRASFYNSWGNILYGCMLLDSENAVGHPLPFYDAVQFLGMNCTILSGTTTVDGEECIVATMYNADLYLSVQKNFAVVRLEVFTLLPNTGERELESVRKLSHFKDLGNGLWLPQLVDEVRYAGGEAILNFTLKVNDISVNEEISGELFSDLFPIGTIVSDGVNGTTYVAGKNQSIAGMISEAIPEGRGVNPQRGRTWQIFIVFNTVALVVLLFLYFNKKNGQGGETV